MNDYYHETGGDVVIDPNNSNIIWTGGLTATNIFNVSKTTDNGATWSRDTIGTAGGYMYTMEIDPSNTSIVYAAGQESSAPAVFRTTDAGASWSKLAAAGLSGNVYALAIDPTNGSTVYAGTASGVCKSTDRGATWTGTGFTGGPTKALVIHDDGAAEAVTLFAGTAANGVYASYNGGGSWTQINTGLNDPYINCLGINPADRYLFAGTASGSIYRESTIVHVAETGGRRPEPGRLAAGVTTPVRGRLELSIRVRRAGAVKVRIFDANGAAVKTVFDDRIPAGELRACWDGDDVGNRRVPAGVYFLRVDCEGESEITKLIRLH